MKRTLILALALALGAAACGDAPDDATGDTAAPTTNAPTTTTLPDVTTTMPDVIDPDALLLEIRFEGGFVPVEFAYNPMPRFVLYQDGRLLFPAPIPEIFPGPMLTPFQQVELTSAQLTELIAAVEAAGLPDVDDERYIANEGVADAADTVFRYVDDGVHRVAIYALELSEDADPTLAPYAELIRLLDEYAFGSTPAQPFEAERYQVLVSPSQGMENEDFATVEPWPLTTPAADLPVNVFGELRCVELTGDEAVAAAEVFAAANQMTFFEDEGMPYRLTVRPLAPHETGCPAS